MDWSNKSLQLTVALATGLGCGILIGLLLADRRRRTHTLTGSHTAVVSQPRHLSKPPSNDCGDVFVLCVQGRSFLSVEKVEGEYKMVFVVRNDLKMGKGKVAAQVSQHGCHDLCVLTPPSPVWTCCHRCIQAADGHSSRGEGDSDTLASAVL